MQSSQPPASSCTQGKSRRHGAWLVQRSKGTCNQCKNDSSAPSDGSVLHTSAKSHPFRTRLARRCVRELSGRIDRRNHGSTPGGTRTKPGQRSGWADRPLPRSRIQRRIPGGWECRKMFRPTACLAAAESARWAPLAPLFAPEHPRKLAPCYCASMNRRDGRDFHPQPLHVVVEAPVRCRRRSRRDRPGSRWIV